jgi:hypothetical protein
VELPERRRLQNFARLSAFQSGSLAENFALALETAVPPPGQNRDAPRYASRFGAEIVSAPIEHDAAGFTRFTKAVGHRVQIVGDDFLVTDAAPLRRAAAMPACNAILVKPNQVGTF